MSQLPKLQFHTSVYCKVCSISYISHTYCDVEIRAKGYEFECVCGEILLAPFTGSKVILDPIYIEERRQEHLSRRKLARDIVDSPRFKLEAIPTIEGKV